jgi:nitroreductase
MYHTILNHRSIRKFTNEPVTEEQLNRILTAAGRASTTGNMQVYCIIVNRDPELRKQLWEAHFKQNMVLEAPVHLTFCADFNRFTKWCEDRKADPGYDNFLSFLTGAIDAILASQNAALAAESEGLGICYLGTATWMAGRIIEILNLPKLVVPVASIVLGHPAENPPLTDRLPLEGIVHRESYSDYTATDINSIYRDRESLKETIDLLKINGTETLAQVFTEKRYTRKDNRFFSNEFIKVLHQQGFMNNSL